MKSCMNFNRCNEARKKNTHKQFYLEDEKFNALAHGLCKKLLEFIGLSVDMAD